MNFREKAIFLWCYWDTFGGDVGKIAAALVQAKFEAVYVHTTDGAFVGSYNGRINCTAELVAALKGAGLTVYGWGAVYGQPVKEAQIAADQTEKYGLDGYVFDGESTWDAQPAAVANTEILIRSYQNRCPGVPVAWCWWPFYESWAGTTPYHPKAVLTEAMKYADVGMPMAYWEGSTALAAVNYINEAWQQWRAVTQKPIVPAGRAWTGNGGESSCEAVLAFDARARELGAVGITWWSMQHAVRLPWTWQALSDTKPFSSEEEIPMDWTNNAIGLFAASKDAPGWDNPSFNFAVCFAGGNWTVQNSQYILEPNPDLAPMEKLAHDKGLPFLPVWDFNVGWYTNQQIIADDAHWPDEAHDYPLQRLINALQSRDVDGLIIRVMNRKDIYGTKDEMMSTVAYAAGRFAERANKWLYTNKGMDKWTFILTNDAFLRTKDPGQADGAQENFYSWTKYYWLGIEKEAVRPLMNGAWPQPTDAPGAIPPSLGWKFWYHYNTASLDMLIYNGTNADIRAFLGVDGETPGGGDGEPDPETPPVMVELAAIKAQTTRILEILETHFK